jgi:hypothetical protein
VNTSTVSVAAGSSVSFTSDFSVYMVKTATTAQLLMVQEMSGSKSWT